MILMPNKKPIYHSEKETKSTYWIKKTLLVGGKEEINMETKVSFQ